MKFNVDKGCGRFIANAIRQMIYVKRYVVRPVAFKVGIDTNILTAGNLFIEDMIKFSSDLSSLRFAYDGPGSKSDRIIRRDCVCHGELRSRDLEGDGIRIVGGRCKDDVLLHTVAGDNTDFAISIIFRNAQGGYTHDENKYAIMASLNGAELDSSYVVMSSRHSDVISVKTGVSAEMDCDVVDISAEVYTGEPEDAIVSAACESMKYLLGQMS